MHAPIECSVRLLNNVRLIAMCAYLCESTVLTYVLYAFHILLASCITDAYTSTILMRMYA